MLGVEVFRDKQGPGHKQRDGGEEDLEKEGEEATAGGADEERMDPENGGEDGSEPRVDGSSQGGSS